MDAKRAALVTYGHLIEDSKTLLRGQDREVVSLVITDEIRTQHKRLLERHESARSVTSRRPPCSEHQP